MGYIDGNDVQRDIYCRLMIFWLHELLLSTISIGIDIAIGAYYHHYNINMLDVDTPINVISRAHICDGSKKCYKIQESDGTYHIQSIPYNLGNPQFTHPTLPNTNVLKHFALGYPQRAMPLLA
jgi:hypothetical protein